MFWCLEDILKSRKQRGTLDMKITFVTNTNLLRQVSPGSDVVEEDQF